MTTVDKGYSRTINTIILHDCNHNALQRAFVFFPVYLLDLITSLLGKVSEFLLPIIWTPTSRSLITRNNYVCCLYHYCFCGTVHASVGDDVLFIIMIFKGELPFFFFIDPSLVVNRYHQLCSLSSSIFCFCPFGQPQ